MNYGISILFRAIPLLMALFCFGYGAFVLHEGLDSAKFVAGPVVFSLGMICIALFATAATITSGYRLPGSRTHSNLWLELYARSCHGKQFRGRTRDLRSRFHHSLCSYHSHSLHPLHPHSRQLGTYRPATTCRCIQFLPGIYPDSSCHPYGSNGMDMGLLAIVKKQRAQCILCSRPCHGRTCLYLFQLGGAGCNHRPPDTQQLYKV